MNQDRIITHSFKLYFWSVVLGTICFSMQGYFPINDFQDRFFSMDNLRLLLLVFVIGLIFGLPSYLVHMLINYLFRTHVRNSGIRWMVETFSALLLTYISLLLLLPSDNNFELDAPCKPYFYGSTVAILFVSIKQYASEMRDSLNKATDHAHQNDITGAHGS